MNSFDYARAEGAVGAVKRVSGSPRASFLAGGTGLIDLMRLHVESHDLLVDVSRVPLTTIEATDGGGLRVGANVRNSDLAHDPTVRRRYPALSEALLSGASAQLRNMATVGGNLMQRTRCPYFRDGYSACNKREPNSGCAAKEGYNRSHAVLGVSNACIATHPSDMCVALAALDAVIRTEGPRGNRAIPIAEFHLLPGETPERETVLEHGELITSVELPAADWMVRSHYLKVRDRASFEFALASAAVALQIGNGVVTNARIALGGVATKPWRVPDAEKLLIGEKPVPAAFAAAAEAATKGAVPRPFNGFKVALVRRVIVRALETAAAR
jgi:xanthine dehydrogenase YagS FAD-binding subunit